MSEKLQEKKKEEKEEKVEKKGITKAMYDHYWNIVWVICIVIAIFFTFKLAQIIWKYIENEKRLKPADYKFPEISDLLPTLYLMPIIMVMKFSIQYLSKGLVEYCLADKYKHPKNEEYKKLAAIYRHKMARHCYKIIFYVGITIFGYYVLEPLDYFPKSMLGHGSMYKLFDKGFPASVYHKKTKYFDLYYNICLAYFSNDFVLLFLMERQSDFINMILHHICTLSLIIFSFLSNYSNVGSLVLFLHMNSDIFVHITRFLIQTDLPLIVSSISGIMFAINFPYMRQYVFGEIIYHIIRYVPEWSLEAYAFVGFLLILYLMHVNWSCILIFKTIQLFTTRRGKGIIDNIDYDKLVKGKDKNNNAKVE